MRGRGYAMKGPSPKPLLGRLLARVVKTSACWLWTGAVNNKGYGLIGTPLPNSRTKLLLVHRVSYDFHVGPIPDGATIDHLCYTPRCVNPAHLEPVSLAENIRRAAARKTTCPTGHPLVRKYSVGVRRHCRVCKNARRRATRP